ncbi:unnamed protein product [Chironomus riparius]|uniref:Uncharacterized protein n=1 Tax=Chironomus riparius TaxID=315576 RepID=A0A9P0IZN3_9DIPT|nr:unnamed protein product [Chironomus riparius]
MLLIGMNITILTLNKQDLRFLKQMALTFLMSFGPFNDDYIVIMYYIILTIVCTFLIALVVGGFWMILVVYKVSSIYNTMAFLEIS